MRTTDRPACSVFAVTGLTALPNGQTGSGAHLASCSLHTAIFPECKEYGCDGGQPSGSNAEVKNGQRYAAYCPYILHGLHTEQFTFTFFVCRWED
jgi:hypothetical protein